MNGHVTQWISVGLAILLLGCTASARAAPAKDTDTNGPGRARFEGQSEEQQLRSLKFLPANVAVSKMQTQTFRKVDGKTEMHRTNEDKVQDADTGNVVAKLTQETKTSGSNDAKPHSVTKTEIDIPSEGIHRVVLHKDGGPSTADRGSREASDSIEAAEDYYLPYEGVQYTPGDMAEYIRRTGDDEGVAMAVEELMREGLMSRNEAAAYLEDIKNELEYLQEQYANEGRSRYLPMPPGAPVIGRSKEERRQGSLPTGAQAPTPNASPQQRTSHPTSLPGIHPTTLVTDQAVKKNPSNAIGKSHPKMASLGDGSPDDELGTPDRDSEDISYKDLLERLRIADFLYKEYSLEEVIYQLAKEMFTQSIVKGSKDAEESLRRFSNFLQEETVDGRISKELETRILDVVMAALMDSVGARPTVLDPSQRAMRDPLQRPSKDDRFGRSSENQLHDRERKSEGQNWPGNSSTKMSPNKEPNKYEKSSDQLLNIEKEKPKSTAKV